MTPQEKLNAVETAIRKALPRLMEPLEGCVILEKDYNETYKIHKIADYNFVLYGLNNTGYKIANRILQPNYEILGHDILLSDVLEWLKAIGKVRNNEIEISFTILGLCVKILEYNYKKQAYLPKSIIMIDLSKPYLKDQSEELINILYNLSKK